jgi:hypothetical protein
MVDGQTAASVVSGGLELIGLLLLFLNQ